MGQKKFTAYELAVHYNQSPLNFFHWDGTWLALKITIKCGPFYTNRIRHKNHEGI